MVLSNTARAAPREPRARSSRLLAGAAAGGFATLLTDLAPRCTALLAKRDSIQQQLDAWHLANKGKPADIDGYLHLLRHIGYLQQEPAAVAQTAHDLGANDFTHPTYRAVWELVEANSIAVPYFHGQMIRRPVIKLKNKESGREVWFFNTHNPASTPSLFVGL